MSPSDQRGHRTAISETPFSMLIVTLNDGSVVSATKDRQLLVGPVEFVLKSPNLKNTIEWNFIPNAPSTIRPEDLPLSIDLSKVSAQMRPEVARAIAQRTFFEEIKKLRVVTYMLTSDRILQGDSVRSIATADPRLEPGKGRQKLNEIVTQHRVASVADAIKSASEWVQAKVFQGSYGGGQSATGLYQDVIKKIAKSTYRTKAGLNKTQEARAVANLVHTIADIEKRSQELAVFGLASATISSEILPAIEQTKGNRLHLIVSILEPYLGGLKARQESVMPIYSLLDTFVKNVSHFFSDKKLTYNLRDGFEIFVDPVAGEKMQRLGPSELSSGEQQLILLFCHVLTARDNPSVFIIDEPEISLNVTWQRILVSSLQNISKGADTQFLFASHSLEILTKHRNRVVSLKAA